MGVSRSAKAQLKASGAAPVFACRAWVNFNGTGTVAIRAAGNVSSITDNGVGDYTVNFTTAMSDANYAPVVSGQLEYSSSVSRNAGVVNNAGVTRSSVRCNYWYMTDTGSQAYYDPDVASIAIFR